MESVIVIDRKRIKLSDIVAGCEFCLSVPDAAGSVNVLRSEDGQYVEIEFAKESRRERVFRNVKAD